MYENPGVERDLRGNSPEDEMLDRIRKEMADRKGVHMLPDAQNAKGLYTFSTVWPTNNLGKLTFGQEG
jgi:hypothetical protein